MVLEEVLERVDLAGDLLRLRTALGSEADCAEQRSGAAQQAGGGIHTHQTFYKTCDAVYHTPYHTNTAREATAGVTA